MYLFNIIHIFLFYIIFLNSINIETILNTCISIKENLINMIKNIVSSQDN